MRKSSVMKWMVTGALAICATQATAQGTLSGPPGPMRSRDPEHPAISRDGKQVAFAVRSLNADWQPAGVDLWLVNTDGSNLHQITAGEFDTHPQFSPDGRQIVFLRKMDRSAPGSYKTDVFILDIETNRLRRLTTTPKTEYAPIFAPDGNAVLFIRESDFVFEEGELVRYDLATGEEKVLIDGKYKVAQVAPSPLEDGSYLATMARLGPNNEPLPGGRGAFDDKALVTLRADGSGIRAIYTPADGLSLPKFVVSNSKIYAQVARFIASDFFEIQGNEAKLVGIKEIQFANDLSADGNIFVGADFVDERLNKGVWAYNLTTKEYKVLHKAPKSDPIPGETAPTPETTTPTADTKPLPAPTPTPIFTPNPLWEKAKQLVADGNKKSGDGQYAESIKDYDAALAIDADSQFGYFGRALAYDKLGKTTEALRDYGKAIELDPEYFEAFTNRGALRIRLGQEEAALQDYNAALKIYPAYWVAHFNRGLLRLKRGDRAGALVDFNTSIAEREQFAPHYLKRGELLVAMQSGNEALADFNRYIELQPTDWQGYASRARWYAQSTSPESTKKGIADLNKAIRLHPSDFSLIILRASLHGRYGDYQKAVADYTTAIKGKYQLATTYKKRAAAYRKLGKPALALADEKSAKTVKP